MGSADEPAERNKNSWWRPRVVLVVCLAVFLFGLFSSALFEQWDISAICPKCLQHADIYELRCLGMPVYWRTRLQQASGGIGSSAIFSPAIPPVSPAVYAEIHGAKCRHCFKYGGLGRTSGLFGGGVHRDGSSMQWTAFLPRIQATQALYGAYVRTGDGEVARSTYVLIDEAYPVSGLDLGDAVSAGRLLEGVGDRARAMRETREYRSESDDPRSCLQLTALTLAEMADRLSEVKTSADFRGVLDEFKPRLGPAANEE
jgi:hypothetical protein